MLISCNSYPMSLRTWHKFNLQAEICLYTAAVSQFLTCHGCSVLINLAGDIKIAVLTLGLFFTFLVKLYSFHSFGYIISCYAILYCYLKWLVNTYASHYMLNA